MDTTLGQGCAAAAKSRVRVTADERAEYVRLFETSGKSAAEYCAELGLAESTFAVWRRQIRSESDEPALTEVPPAMVVAAMSGRAIVIRLKSGAELDVPVGTEAAWLTSVLAALS